MPLPIPPSSCPSCGGACDTSQSCSAIRLTLPHAASGVGSAPGEVWASRWPPAGSRSRGVRAARLHSELNCSATQTSGKIYAPESGRRRAARPTGQAGLKKQQVQSPHGIRGGPSGTPEGTELGLDRGSLGLLSLLTLSAFLPPSPRPRKVQQAAHLRRRRGRRGGSSAQLRRGSGSATWR